MHEIEAHFIKEYAPSLNNAPVNSPRRKLTFQIRDSIYCRLIDAQYKIWKQHSLQIDREVIVEEAIAALLDKMDDGEDLGEAIAHCQRIRQQELKSGALINPNSRDNSF